MGRRSGSRPSPPPPPALTHTHTLTCIHIMQGHPLYSSCSAAPVPGIVGRGPCTMTENVNSEGSLQLDNCCPTGTTPANTGCAVPNVCKVWNWAQMINKAVGTRILCLCVCACRPQSPGTGLFMPESKQSHQSAVFSVHCFLKSMLNHNTNQRTSCSGIKLQRLTFQHLSTHIMTWVLSAHGLLIVWSQHKDLVSRTTLCHDGTHTPHWHRGQTHLSHKTQSMCKKYVWASSKSTLLSSHPLWHVLDYIISDLVTHP